MPFHLGEINDPSKKYIFSAQLTIIRNFSLKKPVEVIQLESATYLIISDLFFFYNDISIFHYRNAIITSKRYINTHIYKTRKSHYFFSEILVNCNVKYERVFNYTHCNEQEDQNTIYHYIIKFIFNNLYIYTLDRPKRVKIEYDQTKLLL